MVEKKKYAMKAITLTIICKDGDEEYIEHEFINSPVAQLGIYTWGTEIRDATTEEEAEVIKQTPPEILGEYMNGEE